jgi:hypothetical protein
MHICDRTYRIDILDPNNEKRHLSPIRLAANAAGTDWQPTLLALWRP